MSKKPQRIGLWLIGALGGVGSATALGVAALRRRLVGSTGLVTALPLFDGLDLDEPGGFAVGGHDIRRGDFASAAAGIGGATPAIHPALLEACRADLDGWSADVRPGVLAGADPVASSLADRDDLPLMASPRAFVGHVQADWSDFVERHRLDGLVVVNVASTERLAPNPDARPHGDARLGDLPASSWYAYAAIEAGWPYVNFTPSAGASLPALLQLAQERNVPIAGQDGKTGETLVKTALARMFAVRNLKVLSWVGHNVLGNRDGLVLNDPLNRAAKLRNKDRVVGDILGYQPDSRTTIEYVESLDDWKTAWDFVHFEGFLGVRMALQFTWQGCDSALAAPLVIDLARLAAFAARRGYGGVLRHLAVFFKSPMGVDEHDLNRQFTMLEQFVESAKST